MNTTRREVITAIFEATPVGHQTTQIVDAYLAGDYSELGLLVAAMFNTNISDNRWRTTEIKKDFSTSAILKGAAQYELTEIGKFICDDNVCRNAGVGA